MKSYQVVWEINIDAESPREAAEKALAVQRDPFSCATVFGVQDMDWKSERATVDLEEEDDEEEA